MAKKKHNDKKILLLLMILIISSCSTGFKHTESEINTPECMPLLLPRGLTPGEATEGPTDEPLAPSGEWVIRKRIEVKDGTSLYLRAINHKNGSDYLLVDVGNHEVQVLETKNLEEKATVTDVNYFYVFHSPNQTIWMHRDYAFSGLQIAKLDESGLTEYTIELEHEPKYIYNMFSGPHSTWMVFMDQEYDYYLGELLLDGEFPVLLCLTQIEIPVSLGMAELHEIYPYSRILGLVVDNNDRPYFTYLSKDTSYINTYRFEEDGTFTWVYGFKTTSYVGNLARGFGLYVDENDILWIGDSAWVNIGENPVDYYEQAATIYRSPVFVAKLPPGDGSYQWLHGTPTADTPDGRIWYKSLRGTAWYQPKTGEWCMFSSSRSLVLKDSEGNLWMTYGDALYMLPASETRAKDD